MHHLSCTKTQSAIQAYRLSRLINSTFKDFSTFPFSTVKNKNKLNLKHKDSCMN